MSAHFPHTMSSAQIWRSLIRVTHRIAGLHSGGGARPALSKRIEPHHTRSRMAIRTGFYLPQVQGLVWLRHSQEEVIPTAHCRLSEKHAMGKSFCLRAVNIQPYTVQKQHLKLYTFPSPVPQGLVAERTFVFGKVLHMKRSSTTKSYATLTQKIMDKSRLGLGLGFGFGFELGLGFGRSGLWAEMVMIATKTVNNTRMSETDKGHDPVRCPVS